MGFFSSLLGKAEDVGDDVLDFSRPVTKPVGKKIMQAAHQAQTRVLAPDARQIGLRALIDDPTLFVRPNAMSKWKEEHGLKQDRSLLGLLAPLVELRPEDDPSRKALKQDLSSLPWYEQLALGVVVDPTTFLSVGAVGRAAAAAKGAGKAGLLKAAMSELFAQTGVPSMSKIPYQLTIGAAKGRQIAKVNLIRTMLDSEMAVKQAKAAGAYGELGVALDASNAADAQVIRKGIEATLKGAGVGLSKEEQSKNILARAAMAFKFPDARDLQSQYALLSSKLNARSGRLLSDADFMSQSRRTGFSRWVTTMVGAAKEFDTRFVHDIPAPGLAQRLPGIKHIWKFADPSRAGGAVHDAAVVRGATAEEIASTANIVLGHTSLRAKGVGFIGDARTGIVKGLKPVGKIQPTVHNILDNLSAFRSQLSPKMWDVAKGVRMAIDNADVDAIAYVKGLPEAERGRALERIAKLRDPIEGASDYTPRIGLYYSPETGGAQVFITGADEPSVIRRIMAWAKIPTGPIAGPLQVPMGRIGNIPIPKGFKKIPAFRPSLGTKQSFEYERVLEATTDASRVIFSNDPGEILGRHIQQVWQIVADETVTLASLKKMSKKPIDIIGGKLDVDKILALRFADKAGKARMRVLAVTRVKKGEVPTAAAVADLRRYANSDAFAEAAETRDYLNDIADLAQKARDAQMAVTKAGPKVAKAAGKSGRAQEAMAEELSAPVFADPDRPPLPPGEAGNRTLIQAQKDIDAGRGTQELAAQVTGEGLPPIPLAGDTATRERVIKDILAGEDGKAALEGAEASKYETVSAQIKQQIAESGLTSEMWAKAQVKNPRLGLRSGPESRTLMSDAEAIRQNMVNMAGDFLIRDGGLDMQLKGARAQIRGIAQEKARLLRSSTVFDYRQSKVPGMGGGWFERVIAQDIDNAFLPSQASRDGVTAQAAAMQGVLQGFKAGQDISSTFLQSFATLAANPAGWTKAIAYTLGGIVKPDLYARYLEGLSNSYDLKTGLSVIDQASRARLALSGTEMYAPTETLSAIGYSGGTLSSVARFVTNMPLNRSFAIQRNVASLELFRSQVALEQALLRRGLSDDEFLSVGRQVNLATGVTSNEKLGISEGQATMERLTGRFGVQWFRSQTGRLVQAMQVGTVDGRVARRILIQQMGAMSALYAAAAKSAGQEPDFDPSSRNFLTLQVGNSRVAFGGIYPSMMRTIGNTVEAVATGNEKDLLDIKNGRNPLLNFWRNGAPLVGAMIADAVEVNANTPYAKKPLQELTPTESLPFNVGAGLDQPGSFLDRAIAGGATGVGLNQSPVTATDIWKAASDQYAKEQGAPSWDALPKATQDNAIRDVPELAQADAARQDWFDKHGKDSPLSTAVDHNDMSRAAANDVLAGQWARVQAGEIGKDEFRATYGTWSANHAFLAKNLFGSLSPEDQKKLAGDTSGTLRQDTLAAEFQAIQPVDSTGSGTPSEDDWAEWQAAKDKFWEDNPDAAQYRSYILFDYPTSVWDSPITRSAVTELKRAQDSRSDYLDLPKYKGMTTDEASFFDGLLAAKSRASQELTAIAVQRGMALDKISIPSGTAWQYTVQVLQQQGLKFTQRQADLLKLAAVAEAKPEVKLQLIDPGRFQYLIQHPEVVQWYPSAIQDTGIPTKVLERLGLIQQPAGQTVAERAQTLIQ